MADMKNKFVHWHSLAEVGILALALVVRLIGLTHSFWLDEAAQAVESARPLSEQLHIIPDFQPPLYHLLVHFWMFLGKSEWWLRLTALLPGLITVWLTMQLAKKVADRHTALLAGVLLATAQFHVFYSQELRPYSLAALWGVASTLALLSLWESKKNALYTAYFILPTILGLYTTYLYPTLFITQIIATAIFHRKHLRPVLIGGFLAALTFLPWLPTFSQQLHTGTALATQNRQWSLVVSPPLAKMLPLTVFKFIVGRISWSTAVQTQIFLWLAGYICLSFALSAIKQKKSWELAVLTGLPILIAFGISIFVPVLDPKRLLFCLPFLYIFLSLGANRRLAGALGLIILLNLNLYALKTYATNEDQQREPWRTAIQSIEALGGPDAVSVFTFPEPVAPWQWYAGKNLPVVAVVPSREHPEKTAAKLQAIAAYRTVFLFDYLADITDPGRQIAGSINALGYTETGFFQYPGIGKIHILEKPTTYAALSR